MNIYTKRGPLYAAFGKDCAPDYSDEIKIFLFPTFQEAMTKGTEMLQNRYREVTVEKVEEKP